MTLEPFTVELVHLNEGSRAYFDMYAVTCPRKTCGAEFWVPITWARLRSVDGANKSITIIITGRPCPHCSRVAEIPADIRIEPAVPSVPEPAPKRRTVKIRRR